jgi:ABC-type transport system substrate-binding protein
VNLTVTVQTTQTTLLQAMQQEWAKVPGLNVQLNVVTPFALGPALATRAYDSMIYTSLGETPRVLNRTLSSTSTSNLSFVNDPQLDAALVKGIESGKSDVVDAAMKQVAARINELMPYVPMHRSPWAWYSKKSVHGIVFTAGETFPSEDVWVGR